MKSKGKCPKCGIRKTWATSATAPLASSASVERPHVNVPLSEPVNDFHAAQSQKITDLEASLWVLPDNDDQVETRAFLQGKIAEAKRAITLSKPIESQLNSAVQALSRAQTHKDAAAKAFSEAEANLQFASGKVERLENEVTRVRAAIATTQSQHGDSVIQQSSLEGLMKSMRTVMSDMHSSCVVPEHICVETEVTLKRVIDHISGIAAEAKRHANQGGGVTPSTSKRGSDITIPSPSKAGANADVVAPPHKKTSDGSGVSHATTSETSSSVKLNSR